MVVSVDHHNVATLFLCTQHARAVQGGGWAIDLENEPGSGEWITAAQG